METKINEKTIKVNSKNIDKMTDFLKQGFVFFSRNVIKEWKEDFTDETTGEVVSVNRESVLFRRGERLTADLVSELLFHIQTGDVEEFELSNQRRIGQIVSGDRNNLWSVKVQSHNATGRKKHKLLLHASSAEKAMEIAQDWVELNCEGSFEVVEIKGFQQCIVIENEGEKEDGECEDRGENIYYKIETRLTLGDDDDEIVQEYNFVVSGTSIDDANSKISRFVQGKAAKEVSERGDSIFQNFKMTTLQGSPVSCTGIVSRQFTDAYNEKEVGDEE